MAKKAATIDTPAAALEAATDACRKTGHPAPKTLMAEQLGIKLQGLNALERRTAAGVPVKAEWVLKLAALAGCKPHVIRPDLYIDKWSVPALKLPKHEG